MSKRVLVGGGVFERASRCVPAPSTHPADLMDEVQAVEVGGGAGFSGEASEAFHRLFLALIPAASHGGGNRRFRACLYRMCALAWRLAPEVHWPGMSGEEVARSIGLSQTSWKRHVQVVDDLLGGRAPVSRVAMPPTNADLARHWGVTRAYLTKLSKPEAEGGKAMPEFRTLAEADAWRARFAPPRTGPSPACR